MSEAAEKDWKKEITAEKNFWHLVAMVWKVPFEFRNLIIPFVLATLVFLLAYCGGQLSISEFVSFVNLSLGWIFSILSFMVAGYTIFATVTNLELSIALMKHEHEASGLPFLKYLHATFYKAILSFTFLGFFGVFVVLFFSTKKFIPLLLISYLVPYKNAIVSVLYSWYVFMLSISFMLLFSFLFNIYASVMMAVRWKAEQE